MTTAPALIVEGRGPAVWLILNRPAALNSLNMQLVQAIQDAVDALASRTDVRCVVVTGAGRAFSAGGDLKEFEKSNGGYRSGKPLFGAISRALSALEALPIPVIAAVNGIAVAGGLEIVLACDIVVAAKSAVFGDGHARYGLLPGGGGSVRLPRKIGLNRAKYMMLTARTFDASVMCDWGLVNEIVADGELEAAVESLVAGLAAASPLGLRRMKQMIEVGVSQPLDIALAAEQDICTAHDNSFDRNEGLAAFAARRTPQFRGQ